MLQPFATIIQNRWFTGRPKLDRSNYDLLLKYDRNSPSRASFSSLLVSFFLLMLLFLFSCPQRAEIAGFSLQFLLIFSRSHTNAYAPWDLPIWRRSKIAGFKNSPRRTIGCSIQSFCQISV